MGVSLLEETEINQPSTMKMKGLAVLLLAIGITEAQLKFGGSSSSSNSGSSSSSSSGSQDTSTDTRFFGLTSGNEAIDGGIVGVGAGLLGGALLSGALNGGGNNNNYNSNYNNPCGRRKRQADGDDTNTRLFGLLGGNNNGCNCGRRRRRRQAPGEDGVGVRFFGLENLLGGGNNCGCNCGYNQYPQNNYPSNNYPSNTYPSNSNSNQQQGGCQCNYQLTFQDKYGRTHGACKQADQTGRTWCYTTGGYPGCSDARQSQRFPNNPWSYQACSSFSG